MVGLICGVQSVFERGNKGYFYLKAVTFERGNIDYLYPEARVSFIVDKPCIILKVSEQGQNGHTTIHNKILYSSWPSGYHAGDGDNERPVISSIPRKVHVCRSFITFQMEMIPA